MADLGYGYSPGSTPPTNSASMDLGSIVGGGASLLGDIFNLFGQSSAARQQQQWARDTAQIERNWALEDRAHQEQYTSPEAQMDRLKAAGLNPNLVYGEGVTATGQSEQPRPVSFNMPNFNTGLSAFSNLGAQAISAMQTTPGINKTLAETSEVNQNVTNKKIQAVGLDLQNTFQKLSNTVLASDPRTDESIRNLFHDMFFQNYSSESEMLDNQRQASKLLSSKADQELNNMKDANKRANMENLRQQAKQAPTLAIMAQTLQLMWKQGVGMDADNVNKAAQFNQIMSSHQLMDADRMLKNMPPVSAKETISAMTDLFLMGLKF